MNIDIASIKDLGIPTIFVIFGLFLLGLTFLDLSRSEGKWQFKTREKYPWPLGITAVILILAGIALILTGFNPDASIQESLENATATISFLETHIAEKESANETQQSTAETQVAVAKSAAETQKAIAQTAIEAQIPTGTIVALHTKLADAQATSAASSETLVALQATHTGEAGTLLSTISAQATKLADALNAIPPTPEPPPQALITEVAKVFSTANEMLVKPTIKNATLDDRFHKDAKSIVMDEIDNIKKYFDKIEDPIWVIEGDVDHNLREGSTNKQKIYDLIADPKVIFYGVCPDDSMQQRFEWKYPRSVIRASITEYVYQDSSRISIYVIHILLDHKTEEFLTAQCED